VKIILSALPGTDGNERQEKAHSTDVRQVIKFCAAYYNDTSHISNYI